MVSKEEFDNYRAERELRCQKQNKAADDILEYIKKQQLCYNDVKKVMDIIKNKIRYEIIID